MQGTAYHWRMFAQVCLFIGWWRLICMLSCQKMLRSGMSALRN